ncbi:MAG: SDR family NAD(P)-dependent oxidoreductase, partial [Thermoplasmata archaeon]
MAFVTGASRGIGKQTALSLARSGLDVAIGARTLQEGQGRDDGDPAGRPVPGSLESTASLVAEEGRRALPVRMDLTDHESLERAVEEVVRQWGRIDVLVNNAVSTAEGSMTRFLDLSVPMLEAK